MSSSFSRQTRESTRLARRFGSSVTFKLADGKFRKLESYSVDGLWNQITDAFESLHFWNVRAYR